MADAKLTALTALSVAQLDDLLYSVDVHDTTDDPAGSSRSLLLSRLLGLGGITPGGRLTLTTSVPVTTSDVTGATTIYYTPYTSDYVRLYDGTRVREYLFTERSLALGTITSARPYDVWLYDNAGTLTMELLAWTSDTARATALAWQSGLGWTKSGDATRFYLGTFRTTSTTTTEDSAGGVTTQVGGKRFLWNAYNRVARPLAVFDSTDTWTYASSAYRIANGASTPSNCVGFVQGIAGDMVRATVTAMMELASGTAGGSGVGLDSGTVNAAVIRPDFGVSTTGDGPLMSSYGGIPGIGYHYLAWLEYRRAGTVTFYGDAGIPGVIQSGMIAEVMA